MRALGLIEVMGLPGAIEAADAALKAANVTLLQVAKVGSGIMTVEITGDVGAVTAAVEAGAKSASAITTLRAKHVIPRMDQSLVNTVVSIKEKNAETTQVKEEKQQATQSERKETDSNTTTKKVKIESESDTNISGDASEGSKVIEESSEEDTGVSEMNSNVMKVSNENQNKTETLQRQESIIETLSKKSNSQLKNMVTDLGIELTQEEIKRMKKQELVEILERHLKESIEKGESEWK